MIGNFSYEEIKRQNVKGRNLRGVVWKSLFPERQGFVKFHQEFYNEETVVLYMKYHEKASVAYIYEQLKILTVLWYLVISGDEYESKIKSTWRYSK